MFEIAKTEVKVKLSIHHGTLMEGSVFISPEAGRESATPRMEFLLNRKKRFFPFKALSGKTLLINKEELLFLDTDEDDHHFFVKELGIKPQKVKVLMANSEKIIGEVYPDLSPDANRVSDFFNQDLKFFPIYRDGHKIIINVRHVLSVEI